MKLITTLITILIGYISYIFIFKNNEQWDNSILEINQNPIQKNIDSKETFNLNGFRITKEAIFEIEARVLGKKSYSDKQSDISKYDLALGWKEMSNRKNLEKIKIWQEHRWFKWRVDSFFIDRKAIEHNSSNIHIIPANKNIEKTISNIKKGQIIKAKGYLVSVKKGSNFRWVSSMSRTDTGDGACEIFYVENIYINPTI